MPQKGLLQKKREELEALAAISTRPEPELARLIEEGNVEAVAARYQIIQHCVHQMLAMTLGKCVGTILQQDGGFVIFQPTEVLTVLHNLHSSGNLHLRLSGNFAGAV